MQLESAFDKRRRRAALAGIGAGILSFVVTFLFYALLKSLGHRGAIHALFTLIAQSLYVGAPIFGFLVYRRLANAGALLVWLRPFRSEYGTRIRFHRCLAQACSAIVNPVTIQDSSFASSFFSAVLRAWVIFPLLMILWLIGMLLVVVPEPLGSSNFATMGSLIAWTALYGWAVWAFLRRMGFRTLTGQGALSEARHRLSSLPNGSGPVMGIEVLRCHDDIWKNVVSLALSQAHIAIIDVTEPTENVLWELSQAQTCLSEDSILVVCENETVKKSADVLSKHWGERPLMTYPALQAPVGPGRKRQYAELTDRLRKEIALRVGTKCIGNRVLHSSPGEQLPRVQ